MPPSSRQVAVFDDRPFFAKALAHGVRAGILDRERLQRILDDGPKGIVQIAEYFGTQYLRPNIEQALVRMVNLVSLHLEETSGGDLDAAARSLRENTFLSHSRGGSEMLKRLWAMPEDSSIGIDGRQSQKEFLALWSLRSLAEYRRMLEHRQVQQAVVSTALELAGRLGLKRSEISTVASESLIRSAVLVYLSGSKPPAIPTRAGLAAIVAGLRGKGVPGAGRRQLDEVMKTLPPACATIAKNNLRKVEAEDIPKILDGSRPLNEVIQRIEPFYFLREFDIDDASVADATLSNNWKKLTGGKTDDHSLLTVFVCLAAGVPARSSLSRSAARTLVRKARAEGLASPLVTAFIRDSAPHEMQDDLEALWNEFFPEIEATLLDDEDTSLNEALDFLRENCIVV
ncbi:hypothetical protein [Accumulibacter sp.]|uniref:hypothetical protein n=1 Tax=Accumulibacter sp. TaxID=2053492 RepID=UPI0025FEBEE5|nr:hypothetical protein [Accumulibacter sp.]MCM8595685.1 hypothetical protein [Accumulibacter sp.]MCM8627755.1 hypothetical protein [Accumulibacter sp.]MDS4049832.1 hypothetical protein [Accumulibacter sp.]